MRKVIANIAVSVDGFIEDKNGELDWLVFGEEATSVKDFLSRFDVIFYGRKAYERFGVYLVAGGDVDHNVGFQEKLANMRKYVFSRTSMHVPGNGMVINSNIRENVMQIKEEEGGDIWLCGGAGIIKTFSLLNLIDEYILSVQPVILGKGKSLFANLNIQIPLNLLDVQHLPSGVVILNYEPQTNRKGN